MVVASLEKLSWGTDARLGGRGTVVVRQCGESLCEESGFVIAAGMLLFMVYDNLSWPGVRVRVTF
jgi:hypothetical protein